MTILGMNNISNNGSTFFKEFKKQASFFLKEKIKTARLALTDVTPAELLTEEATNGNPWAPDTRTLKMISKAAFEVDDYFRILQILHNRLARFDRNNWRMSYQALIVVEHLLTHGPESVADEFQTDINFIREMEVFQYIDEKGFNWGLNVRKKSEKIINLLNKRPLLKEERDRARKLSRGIEGFGSFSLRTSSAQENLHESHFARSNSEFIKNEDHDEDRFSPNDEVLNQLTENTPTENDMIIHIGTHLSVKGDVAPANEHIAGDSDEWDATEDSESLLCDKKDDLEQNGVTEDHPFHDDLQETTVSLLYTTERGMQAC